VATVDNDGRHESLGNTTAGEAGVLSTWTRPPRNSRHIFLVKLPGQPPRRPLLSGNPPSAGRYDQTGRTATSGFPAERRGPLDQALGPGSSSAHLQHHRKPRREAEARLLNSTEPDALLGQYLNTSSTSSTTSASPDDTLSMVRTADHGEDGHSPRAPYRQKNFNFTRRRPRPPRLSNPKLFTKPLDRDAHVLAVEFLPTLDSCGAPAVARPGGGVDYSSMVLNPNRAKPAQYYIVSLRDYK